VVAVIGPNGAAKIEIHVQRNRRRAAGGGDARESSVSSKGGRCGLWSKADSQVLFDDFSVTRK